MTGDLWAAADLSKAAGPLGLLVILLLGVATVLLIRSMDRHMKNLPKEFPPPPDRDAGDPPAPPGR